MRVTHRNVILLPAWKLEGVTTAGTMVLDMAGATCRSVFLRIST